MLACERTSMATRCLAPPVLKAAEPQKRMNKKLTSTDGNRIEADSGIQRPAEARRTTTIAHEL